MSLPINRLMVLDALFRDRSSLDWSYDWRTEEPINLITPSMSEQEVIMHLLNGINSLNLNISHMKLYQRIIKKNHIFL